MSSTIPSNPMISTLQKAVNEVQADGELSQATMAALFALGSPTAAMRDFAEWASKEKGGLDQMDQLTLAGLLQPISLPTNPKLEGLLNKARETGKVSDADAKAIFESMGKLSEQEERTFHHLLRTLQGTPHVSDDRIVDLLDQKQPLHDARKQFEAGHHKSIQKKRLGGMIAAIAAIAGVMFTPAVGEAVQELASNLPMYAESAGHVLQVALAFGAAWGAGSATRAVTKPEKNLQAIQEYGIND